MKTTADNRIVFFILILFLVPLVFPAVLSAQSDDSDSLLDTDDFDSLFADDDTAGDQDADQSEEQKDDENQEEKDAGLLDSLTDDKKLDVSAKFTIYAGYSPGFDTLQPDAGEEMAYTHLFLLALNSDLALNFDIADNFRVFQRFNIVYPDIELIITEFFADYSFKDILMFRIGLQKIRWGESKNFPFTDLPNRMPDTDTSANYSGNNRNLAYKMAIPIGVGGLEFLASTKLGYWEKDSYPGLSSVGFGLKWNLVLAPFDFNLGAYYRQGMNFRGFVSTRVTLFGNVETYAEALVAVDPWRLDDPLPYPNDDNPLDFSGNIGIYTDFADKAFEIGAEFFYNGEESELTGFNSNLPILWGSNICLYLALNSDIIRNLKIFFHSRYNIEQNSIFFVPGLSFNLSNNFSVSFAGAILLGDKNKGYFLKNPDPLDREAMGAVRIIFSGSI